MFSCRLTLFLALMFLVVKVKHTYVRALIICTSKYLVYLKGDVMTLNMTISTVHPLLLNNKNKNSFTIKPNLTNTKYFLKYIQVKLKTSNLKYKKEQYHNKNNKIKHDNI